MAALLDSEEVGQQAVGHLDHLDDAGGDLGDTNAVGFTAGQKDLDRFGGCCSCGFCLRHQATNIDLAGDGGGDQAAMKNLRKPG
jgi:hypothetical protein